MTYQATFKRYELKYLLTREQKEIILEAMKSYMQLDKYGKTTIRNLYYDTDNYLLIRRSIEKPMYKEKLRLRCYQQAKDDSPIFVELKKKYDHVVYKRRVTSTEKEAVEWINGEHHNTKDNQIAKEIDYFMNHYGHLHPTVFLSYDREAFYSNDGSDFRVTFDDNILCRQDNLSLSSEVYGTQILPVNQVIMEIKCSGCIPLWMTEVLSKQHLYVTSFSKYGAAYQTMIYPQMYQTN